MPLQRAMPYVLAALRSEIVSGDLLPGQPLRLAELSDRFRVSASPIREVLAHLAGEGLLEESRGAGYICRRISERDYIELCEVQHHLLAATVLWREGVMEASARRAEVKLGPESDVARGAAWFFSAFVALARHRALQDAYAPVSGRLGAARRAEAQVLTDVAGELLAMAALADQDDKPAMLKELENYHRRRRAVASVVCDVLRDQLSCLQGLSSSS